MGGTGFGGVTDSVLVTGATLRVLACLRRGEKYPVVRTRWPNKRRRKKEERVTGRWGARNGQSFRAGEGERD